jgi:hypothetical protein
MELDGIVMLLTLLLFAPLSGLRRRTIPLSICLPQRKRVNERFFFTPDRHVWAYMDTQQDLDGVDDSYWRATCLGLIGPLTVTLFDPIFANDRRDLKAKRRRIVVMSLRLLLISLIWYSTSYIQLRERARALRGYRADSGLPQCSWSYPGDPQQHRGLDISLHVLQNIS